jgi:hypothetical protein
LHRPNDCEKLPLTGGITTVTREDVPAPRAYLPKRLNHMGAELGIRILNPCTVVSAEIPWSESGNLEVHWASLSLRDTPC